MKYKCKNVNCKVDFEARQADRARGWALFCSKSCKAVDQESRTGQYAAFKNGKTAKQLQNSAIDNTLKIIRRKLQCGEVESTSQDPYEAAMDGVEDGGWDAHKGW